MLATIILLRVCGATLVPLEEVTPEQAQNLLTSWRLSKDFSESFAEYEIGGVALAAMVPEDIEPLSRRPSALIERILWKHVSQIQKAGEVEVDATTLAATQPFSKRRRAKAVDTSAFNGVNIRNDNSIIRMGKASDVSIARVGAGKALAVGDFDFKGVVNAKGLQIDGVDCKCKGDSNTPQVKSLQDQIRVLQKLAGLTEGQTSYESLNCKYPKDSFQCQVLSSWSGPGGFKDNDKKNWPDTVWKSECAGKGAVLHTAIETSNKESNTANQIIFRMINPVSVGYFGVTTRKHPGGSYMGNSKLYGCVNGAGEQGAGCVWKELGHVKGDGVCKPFAVGVNDVTAYRYFKVTFFDNNRKAYQSASHISIKLRSPCDYPENHFACYVKTYYTTPSTGFAAQAKKKWPKNIWDNQCDGSGTILHSNMGEKCSPACNAETHGGNQIIFKMTTPVSVDMFGVTSRQDVGDNHYFGNAKLYGCNKGGKGDNGAGCTWEAVAHLQGTGHACRTYSQNVYNNPPAYIYYKATLFGNARGAHEAVSNLNIRVSHWPPTCQQEEGSFACMVENYWSGPKGFEENAGAARWPSIIWDNECGGTGDVLHTNVKDSDKDKNLETNPANWIVYKMREPVSVSFYGAMTRTHGGGVYFGESKLYGCNGGTGEDGKGCKWVPIAHLFGKDGVCQPFSNVVTDTTKYEYFRTTFFSNNRNAYESLSHIQIDIRSNDDMLTDVQKCQKQYGPDAFRCFVGNYWSGPKGFEANAGSKWPNIIWNNECAGEGGVLHSSLGEKCSGACNAETNTGNWIVFHMIKPVAVYKFHGTTRTHPGGSYFGNAKLYGCNGGSGQNGSGCKWKLVSSLKGEGVCKSYSDTTTDFTAYEYYKLTLSGNARTAHESASHFDIRLRTYGHQVGDYIEIYKCKFTGFPCYVENAWSGSNGYHKNSGSNWPEGIWTNECKSQGSVLHTGDIGNSASTTGNWIVFKMTSPVAIKNYLVMTRTHGGGNYHGQSKIYGCNGGSGPDGSGCSWVLLGGVSGDGVCKRYGTAIGSTTKYGYFRVVIYGNGRGTYGSMSHLEIQMR